MKLVNEVLLSTDDGVGCVGEMPDDDRVEGEVDAAVVDDQRHQRLRRPSERNKRFIVACEKKRRRQNFGASNMRHRTHH